MHHRTPTIEELTQAHIFADSALELAYEGHLVIVTLKIISDTILIRKANWYFNLQQFDSRLP